MTEQPKEYLTPDDWRAEAERRFGANRMLWKFVCPSCHHVASVQQWKDAGATEGEVAFSCIGRHTETPAKAEAAAFKRAGGPCNYTGGGLFKYNPIKVSLGSDTPALHVFAFADPSAGAAGASIGQPG